MDSQLAHWECRGGEDKRVMLRKYVVETREGPVERPRKITTLA